MNAFSADMVLEYAARGCDWLADRLHRLGARVFLMDGAQRSYLDMLVIAVLVGIIIAAWRAVFDRGRRFMD